MVHLYFVVIHITIYCLLPVKYWAWITDYWLIKMHIAVLEWCICICNCQTVVLNPKWNLATFHFFCILITQRAGPEDRVLYIANDTEIRSFVYPFNQSHGHKVHARIEENARIIGMDALYHQQKFIWATQFNPGGLFYKDILNRSQTKTNVGIIVSIMSLVCSIRQIFSGKFWMFPSSY